MSEAKTLEQFEAWATSNDMGLHLARSKSGLYVSPVTQRFSGCWVAAQAKQAAEVEALRNVLNLAAARMIAAKECFDRNYAGEWSGELHLAVSIKEIDIAVSEEAGQ